MLSNNIFLLCWFSISCLLFQPINAASPAVRLQLYTDLMRDYSKSIRLQPTATVVTLDPAIYSIIDVNEARESIVVAQWFEINWKDDLLKWDPRRYENISEMRIQQSMIWVPDITIYQLLESSRQGSVDESFLTVSSDGNVFLSRTEQITVHCAFDVGDFPNDKQNCTLTYVTWAYPSDEIELKAPKARTEHYKRSSEWQLLGYAVEANLVDYGAGLGSWYEISYYIAIQRKPLYYIITLTVPSFFITNLALLGVFSPSQGNQERHEKVTIGLTALLTMAVILMMVSDLMPKNASSFPKLGSYILWEMSCMGASTLLAVVIMYVRSKAAFNEDIPDLLRTLFQIGPSHSLLRSRALYNRLSHSETVGEKLALHCDDWLTGDDPREYKLTCRMYLTLQKLLYKTRQIHVQLIKALTDEECVKEADQEWTLLCYRMDAAALFLSIGTNVVVTFYFYIN